MFVNPILNHRLNRDPPPVPGGYQMDKAVGERLTMMWENPQYISPPVILRKYVPGREMDAPDQARTHADIAQRLFDADVPYMHAAKTLWDGEHPDYKVLGEMAVWDKAILDGWLPTEGISGEMATYVMRMIPQRVSPEFLLTQLDRLGAPFSSYWAYTLLERVAEEMEEADTEEEAEVFEPVWDKALALCANRFGEQWASAAKTYLKG